MRNRALQPKFFWQGVFILLPVFFLAGLGIYSLREDKVAIQREAMDQAAKLREELETAVKRAGVSAGFNVGGPVGSRFLQVTFRDAAIPLVPFHESHIPLVPLTEDLETSFQQRPESWPIISLTSPTDDFIYRIATEHPRLQVAVFNGNELIYPRAYEPAPRGVDPFAALPAEQLELLYSARAVQSTNAALAEDKLRQLISTNLPSGTLLNLQFERAQLLLRSGAATKANTLFMEIAETGGWNQSPAGIPLVSLARFKSAEILCASPASAETKQAAVAAACAAAVYSPSILSETFLHVLDKMETTIGSNARPVAKGWLRVWATHELSRDLVASKPVGPTMGWIEHSNRWRFAHISYSNAGINVFKAQSFPDLAAGIDAVLADMRKNPPYFDFGVQIGGHAFATAKTEGLIGSLSSSSSVAGENAASGVTVSVIRPELLFAHYRKRQLWAGALIGAAALTSVIGFGAAYGSFRRQRRLSEMKSNFVSSVSHELRAPIASVRLMAESLEREKITEPQKQKEYFKFIGQECRRLSSLIENVLDFSRIEQGRKQYELEPTDVIKLIGETVKLMEPYASEKGVTLCTRMAEIPATHCQPPLDGRSIQQALINLIDNAIKHSRSGQAVTVAIGTCPSVLPASRWQSKGELPMKSGKHVEITVEDQGPGIPKEEHEKIFQRFYRLGSELRRETQGIGIGLSIVQHIVETHHGRVRVESEVGKGSRFTMQLPIEQVEQNDGGAE